MMKNFLKKAMLIVLAVSLTTFTFAACGNNNELPQRNDSLKIVVYNGGYGVDWANTLIEKFAEEDGTNLVVDVKPDNGLLATLKTDLEAPNGEYDLFFSHGITWEQYALQGYLEPLDDLYNSTEVENGILFKDRMTENLRNTSKFNDKYYKVPWTQGAGGIAYNMGIMDSNGWEVPQTYDDLMQLCKKIVDKNLKSGTDTVAPFVWAGTDPWLWDYVVYEWWGQLAGSDKVKQLMKYENKDVFDSSGNWAEMKKAYEYWYELICKNPSYSYAGSAGTNKFNAQASFVAGKAVMMPNAHWLFTETKKSASADFKMELHTAPTLIDAKEGHSDVNFQVGFGDSIILPKNSKNKAVAKRFLTFLAKEENSKLFSTLAPGVKLGFDYDMSTILTENRFAQSVSKIQKNSVHINTFSTSPLAIILGSEKISPWPNNDYYYKNSFTTPATYTPSKVMDDVYAYVSSNWNNWERAAGLR